MCVGDAGTAVKMWEERRLLGSVADYEVWHSVADDASGEELRAREEKSGKPPRKITSCGTRFVQVQASAT